MGKCTGKAVGEFMGETFGIAAARTSKGVVCSECKKYDLIRGLEF